jgi:DNA polymerase-4/protein ImuB
MAHFPFQVELQARPELHGRQCIIADLSPGERRVVDTSPQVKGVAVGMPLPEALSRCSGAVLLEADLSRYQAAFEHLLDSLERVSPLVEGADLGLAYVGLDGLGELYGGEEALLAALGRAVAPYQAGTGIGEAKFTAYLAARSSEPDGVQKVPREVHAFLRDFPVDVLPLPWHTIERLRSFGLYTLGEVARLSPGPLQAQFGAEGQVAWELASGIDRRPLVPRRSEERVTESLTLAVPAVALEPVLLAVETLLSRAFRRPQVRGRCVRAVILGGRVHRRGAFTWRVAFKEAVGDAGQAYRLMRLRLLNIQLPGPLEGLSVTLLGLAGETGRQGSLFPEVRQRDSLREALRQLEARLGERPPLYRVREVEPWSRIPERRRALVEYVP